MDEKKKKNNIFLKVLGILFLIYISLYIMDNLGYYNRLYNKRRVLKYDQLFSIFQQKPLDSLR